MKFYCRKVLYYLKTWHPQFRIPAELRHRVYSPCWSETTYSPQSSVDSFSDTTTYSLRSSIDSYSDQSELEEEFDEESSGDSYDGDIESGAESEESSNEEAEQEEGNLLHILLPNLKM